MSISFQSIFHPFQNHDDSTDDQTDLVWDERRSGLPFTTFTSVTALTLQVIGCEGFLDFEWQVDRNPNDLNGQPGPSPHVGIRQLSKGMLKF